VASIEPLNDGLKFKIVFVFFIVLFPLFLSLT